jgi:hypothetical protein
MPWGGFVGFWTFMHGVEDVHSSDELARVHMHLCSTYELMSAEVACNERERPGSIRMHSRFQDFKT